MNCTGINDIYVILEYDLLRNMTDSMMVKTGVIARTT